MPSVDFRQLRGMISIAAVLDLMGYVPRETSGPRWRGPCPLHGSTSETSRSYSVQVERNIYQCFRCGAEGNALDLWAAWTQQKIHPAALDLCQRLGLEGPLIGKIGNPPAPEKTNM